MPAFKAQGSSTLLNFPSNGSCEVCKNGVLCNPATPYTFAGFVQTENMVPLGTIACIAECYTSKPCLKRKMHCILVCPQSRCAAVEPTASNDLRLPNLDPPLAGER